MGSESVNAEVLCGRFVLLVQGGWWDLIEQQPVVLGMLRCWWVEVRVLSTLTVSSQVFFIGMAWEARRPVKNKNMKRKVGGCESGFHECNASCYVWGKDNVSHVPVARLAPPRTQ